MLPIMRSKNQTNLYCISSFGGYNPGYSRKVNELKDCMNTSSENYPALCSLKKPASVRSLWGNALTAGYFDGLYTLEYLGEESGTIKLCTENLQTEILSYTERSQLEHERKLIFMKDEILIIPDNMIYYTNTAKVKAGCVLYCSGNSPLYCAVPKSFSSFVINFISIAPGVPIDGAYAFIPST